jgi:hypothetical protein
MVVQRGCCLSREWPVGDGRGRRGRAMKAEGVGGGWAEVDGGDCRARRNSMKKKVEGSCAPLSHD